MVDCGKKKRNRTCKKGNPVVFYLFSVTTTVYLGPPQKALQPSALARALHRLATITQPILTATSISLPLPPSEPWVSIRCPNLAGETAIRLFAPSANAGKCAATRVRRAPLASSTRTLFVNIQKTCCLTPVHRLATVLLGTPL